MKRAGGFRVVARIAVLGVSLALGVTPALVPAAGLAQETVQAPVDKVIAALIARGYRIVLQERTFFGRVRIVAETADLRREMVINPGTGELLRDYAVALPNDREGSTETSRSGVADAGGSTSPGTPSGGPVASASGGTTSAAVEESGGVDSVLSGEQVLPDPIISH